MTKLSGVLFLAGLCLVAAKSIHDKGVDDKSALKTVTDGGEKFSFDVLKAIGSSNENLVASPLSLHVALGFLSQGAKDTTKQQIIKAAYLPSDDDVTQAGFKSLLTVKCVILADILYFGDAAFIEKTFPIKTSFENVARSSFSADTKSVDFASNPASAIDTINQWVESRTAGNIENLLSSSDVDSETKFVLANTLYFKGSWEKGFNSSLTKKQAFHVDSKTSVETDMMTTAAAFDYKDDKDLDAKVIALNYKGNETRLLIVLPNDVSNLTTLESSITSLDQVKAGLFPEKVVLTLPKFKLEQEQYFKEILSKLGITDVFTTNADLSGISEADKLFVSQVKQKAVLEVNEDGTIAAAATAISGITSVLSHEFKADHGFIFFLEHVPTNNVLMYGRYTKPSL